MKSFKVRCLLGKKCLFDHEKTLFLTKKKIKINAELYAKKKKSSFFAGIAEIKICLTNNFL